MRHLLKIAALALLLPIAALAQSATGVGAPGVSTGAAGSGGGGGGGSGTPGGSNTQFQYNNSGSFGGTAGVTYDNTTNATLFSGQTGYNYTAMSGTAISATLPAETRTLTASEQESFTASVPSGFSKVVRYFASGGAWTVTFNTPVISYGLGDISATGFVVPSGAYIEVEFVGTGTDPFITNYPRLVSLTSDVAGILSAPNGGTGKNNGTNTLTLGGALITSGAFTTTLTATASTSLTLPVSGTLASRSLTQVWTAGAKQTFTPSSTTAGFAAGSFAGDPSVLVDGDIWYNSSTPALRARINGASVSLGAGGGGTPGGSDTQVQYNNSGAFGANAGLVVNKTSGALTQEQDSIGTTLTPGLTLLNATAAASGAQQYSPGLILTGQGWKSTATAASQQGDWALYNQMVQGTTAASSNLIFSNQLAGGGFSSQMILSSGGILSGLNGILATGAGSAGVTIGSTGHYAFTTRSFISSSVDGRLSFWDNAGTTAASISGTTTNNDAISGCTGEYVESLVASGSPVSLTTNTAANVTSISLTAGDWDVSGNINFSAASATVTATVGGISSTTATVPTDGSESYSGLQSTVITEINGVALASKRFSLASTTTVYLVAKSTFTAGTVGAFGKISARRRR